MIRKMEERMLAAIKKEEHLTITNTEVVPVFVNDGKTVSCVGVDVFLYGNHIAFVSKHDKTIELHTRGWATVTTTSRMNAILAEFTDGAYYVTCRTYDKAYGKECRLNKIDDSDWKVTLGL